MRDHFDTIAAIATPSGFGVNSIIKISGKNAFSVIKKIFLKKSIKEIDFSKRVFVYGFIKDPETEVLLDECLVLPMQAPYSYTGEDVAEIQCHNNNISLNKIMQIIFSLGVRQAAPGEFTLRAFLNGKKDLAQAEAVNTIISAKTEFLQTNALQQLRGSLTEKIEKYIDVLNDYCIRLEGDINFPEDVDIEDEDAILDQLISFKELLVELKNSFEETTSLREGVKALILGKPNVGKSTFLNKMLNYERAIVTPFPGTTRDFIEEDINFLGVPLRLIDTAGIRKTDDPVEKIGIERAVSMLSGAQIVFLLLDASTPLSEEDHYLFSLLADRQDLLVFCLINKIDKKVAINLQDIPANFYQFKISLLTDEGINDFRDLFKKRLMDIYDLNTKYNFCITNTRHFVIIKEMLNIIEDLLSAAITKDKLLFSLKDILNNYNKLTGKDISPNDIDAIFNKFCIGK